MWLDSKKTFFLLTSPSKYALSFHNTSSQIRVTLPILSTFTSLWHSLVVSMTNDTCVKSSIAPQVYKVFSAHAHEISVWKIISRLIHSHASHLVGINGGVQSNPATLAFKNEEQPEYLCSIILRIQQEIILSGETVSPTRLIFLYLK